MENAHGPFNVAPPREGSSEQSEHSISEWITRWHQTLCFRGFCASAFRSANAVEKNARHGFRSGLAGVENDTRELKIGGVPARIESVVPMPNSTSMLKILESLRGSAPASTQR